MKKRYKKEEKETHVLKKEVLKKCSKNRGVEMVALKKVHLNFQPPNNKGSWNINLTRYKNREKGHGNKSGAFNVAFMDDGVEGKRDVGFVQSAFMCQRQQQRNLCFFFFVAFLYSTSH